MTAPCENEIRRCEACGTLFESEVADRDPSGEPRCPQCFLAVSVAVASVDARDIVIRTTTPFR